MIIVNPKYYHESHTNLSKYFVERVLQSVDPEEVISYQHPTSNGHTLIGELDKLCSAALKRDKSVRRLQSLIQEISDSNSKSNLKNDKVISSFHQDILAYYKQFGIDSKDVKSRYDLSHTVFNEKLTELSKDRSKIINLQNKTKTFLLRLDQYYILNLKQLSTEIDITNEKEFKRNADLIDKLVENIIPTLLVFGYSPTSIRDVAFKVLPGKNGTEIIGYFFDIFNQSTKRYDYKIEFKKEDRLKLFYQFLARQEPRFTKKTSASQVKDIYTLGGVETVDRNTFMSSRFSSSYRDYIISGTGVEDSLNHSAFFNIISVRPTNSNKSDAENQYFKTLANTSSIDPINIRARTSSLNHTIDKILRQDAVKNIRDVRLAELVYNYKLAIQTQSIEVSMSLLWTTLEGMLSYRYKSNDISNIQYFFSKFLSIGAIGRDIQAFIVRFFVSNHVTDQSLASIPVFDFGPNFTEYGLSNWAKWLGNNVANTIEDPFDLLNSASPLLCNMYIDLNKSFTTDTLEVWLNRIMDSKTSIEYQLDRIYSYRNSVVHSGKLLNEYTTLWTHLEWYVGKILSYCYLQYNLDPSNFSMENAFKKLEGHTDYIVNYLIQNKDEKISSNPQILEYLLKESWCNF